MNAAKPQGSATTRRAGTARDDLAVVILGGDIGVYALARAFHEAYGIRSTVISGSVPGPIANSRIIDNVTVADSHDAGLLVAAAVETAQRLRSGGRKLLLLANSDWLVRVVVRHRETLAAAGYIVPFLDEALLDQISDKATFAEIAGRSGIRVPGTVVQDFADAASWAPVAVPFAYPVIAKAASSADYENVEFPGKKKVFQIDDQAELDTLWSRLRSAGFAGRFVVQELIPGDDTAMRSITAYVDRSGTVTLLAGARVLLEEHTPNGLGNPAAMITDDLGEMFEQAHRFLTVTGYRGYANFDIKVDPRDGSFAFFEVNPRIGRNNYYVTGAGSNVARFLVADHIDDVRVPPVRASARLLYSILPQGLLARYVVDPDLKAELRSLVKARQVVHPLRYRADAGLRRRLYAFVAGINQRRKFRRYYPEPSSTGF